MRVDSWLLSQPGQEPTTARRSVETNRVDASRSLIRLAAEARQTLVLRLGCLIIAGRRTRFAKQPTLFRGVRHQVVVGRRLPMHLSHPRVAVLEIDDLARHRGGISLRAMPDRVLKRIHRSDFSPDLYQVLREI